MTGLPHDGPAPMLFNIVIHGFRTFNFRDKNSSWFSGQNFRIIPRNENTWLKKIGLENKFILLYTGNAGLAHTFDELNHAALRLRDDKDILFLYIGGGKRFTEIREFKEKHTLENIKMLDYLPYELLSYSFSAANVHLVTLDDAFLGISVPSKQFSVMAAGKPLIFIGSEDAEGAKVISETNSGIVIQNNDIDELITKILELKENSKLSEAMGNNARNAFNQQFDEPIILDIWEKLISTM